MLHPAAYRLARSQNPKLVGKRVWGVCERGPKLRSLSKWFKSNETISKMAGINSEFRGVFRMSGIAAVFRIVVVLRCKYQPRKTETVHRFKSRDPARGFPVTTQRGGIWYVLYIATILYNTTE
jgi:hypothetical protein